jgi:hypothetical protein
MDKSQFFNLLVTKEAEAIIRTLAMITFNPAIGRVLQQDSVDRFADLMVETVPKFYGFVTREHFDSVHSETCNRILSFKTAAGEDPSYGQAQKPLNVFLKVYVDFANRPDRELAQKLAPLLHVPLDSVLMKFVKREFPEDYESRIGRLRRQLLDRFSQRLTHISSPRTLARGLLGSEFSLTAINKEIYVAWQDLFRSLYPTKPVACDIFWVLERTRMRTNSSREKG